MLKSSKETHLKEYVTDERLAELARIVSDANRLQAAAVPIQALALVSYYSLLSHELSFWALVPEALFLSSGLSALLLSFSTNPSVRQLNIGLTTTKASLAASAAGLIAALLSSNDPSAFLFFLPGPLLSSTSYLTRRIVAHDLKLREQRGVSVGTYGNLEGVVADLKPYGFEPSTRFRLRHVASWTLFFEGLTITSVLRANVVSPNRLPYNSTLFWTFFSIAISITAVIGLIVGIGIELMRTRWNKAITGRVTLDALESSRLWFYGGNGAFGCYKLFDRPMVTVEDQRLIIAHYPGSFEVRTSSSDDFQLLVSVLQDKTNYGMPGRKVSTTP